MASEYQTSQPGRRINKALFRRVGEVARAGSGAGHFSRAQQLHHLRGRGGLGGLGVLGVLGGHRRRRDFQTIPFGDLLGLLGRTDIIGPILRYISLCAYIGKDPLV
jgi:hypothetical protein